MKEYRKIAKFKYKNNYYIMYLDDNNKHFFLRTDDDNNLHYVTTNELIELTKRFTTIPHNMKIERSSIAKFKFVPKIINSSIAVVLSMSVLTSCVSAQNYESNEVKLQEDVATQYLSVDDDLKKEKSLVVDTYLENNQLHYLYIYDMDYLDKVFENKEVTLQDLYDQIDNNDCIPPKYKELLYEYSEAVVNKYPNVDLRVFEENLKTLKIYEYTKQQLKEKLGSENYSGTYTRKENAIYVLEGNNYEKGSWDYQVIFHELSHCLRTGIYNDRNGIDVKVLFEGQNYWNEITTEALNSLFAVSLFNYSTNEIGYQLQSNYFSIMLECMDNYDLSDYINHSQSYFVQKLDEFNGDDNYATVILDLMQMQYTDYYSDEIEVEQEEYYPIYDYISNMYFNKYITPDMSYEEAYQITYDFVDRVIYNVPKKYNIDFSRIYTDLDNYCDNIGIAKNKKTR